MQLLDSGKFYLLWWLNGGCSFAVKRSRRVLILFTLDGTT